MAMTGPPPYSAPQQPLRKPPQMSTQSLQTLSFVLLVALTLYVAFGGAA